MVDFIGTTDVVCFKQRMTMLGTSTNVVGGICGLQIEKDKNELQKRTQWWDYSGGH